MVKPRVQINWTFFLTPAYKNSNRLGSPVGEDTWRQAPVADRSITVQAIAGFFGSIISLPVLDIMPCGRTRINLRSSLKPTSCARLNTKRLQFIEGRGRFATMRRA